MRRRRPSKLSLFLFAGLVLGACTSTEVQGTDTTLRVILADDWATTDAVLDTVREFEANHPGVRVEIDGVSFSSIVDEVDVSIRAGQPYDLAQWHAFAAGALGLARPVEEIWQNQLDIDEFLPGAYGDVEWAGIPYGIPLDTNALILIANKDQLDAAGILPELLTTFDDLTRAAALLTDVAAERRGIAHSLSSWAAYGWIKANGGELVEVAADGTPTFFLDSPETVEALDFLGQLVLDETAWEPGTRDRSATTTELFLGGNTTMMATGGWDLVEAASRAQVEGIDSPTAIVIPLPGGVDGTTRGTALGGSSLFFPVGGVNFDLATEFAISLINDEHALALAVDEGRLPVRRRVFDNAVFDGPTLAVVRDNLEFAAPMKLIAFEEAQHAFTRALESILLGRESAASALATAQREAEESVAQP